MYRFLLGVYVHAIFGIDSCYIDQSLSPDVINDFSRQLCKQFTFTSLFIYFCRLKIRRHAAKLPGGGGDNRMVQQ